jgi:hypothetical protein
MHLLNRTAATIISLNDEAEWRRPPCRFPRKFSGLKADAVSFSERFEAHATVGDERPEGARYLGRLGPGRVRSFCPQSLPSVSRYSTPS